MSQIENKLDDAMTVGDLINHLNEFDPDAKVVFAIDYGDHSHTQQAIPVSYCECLDALEVLAETAYSTSGICINESDDYDKGIRNVVVIK